MLFQFGNSEGSGFYEEQVHWREDSTSYTRNPGNHHSAAPKLLFLLKHRSIQMYVYILTYYYICRHMYIRTYMHTDTSLYTRMNMCICRHVYTYTYHVGNGNSAKSASSCMTSGVLLFAELRSRLGLRQGSRTSALGILTLSQLAV